MEAIKTKTANKNLIDNDYMALVKHLPLCRIKNDKEMDAASDVLDGLSNKIVAGIKLTQGELTYMDTLSLLIGEWERTSPRIQQFRRQLPKISTQQILRSFMEDHKLTQSELAKQIDCPQPVISDFLSGKRGLSKTAIAKLSNYFKVSPALFLPEVNIKSQSTVGKHSKGLVGKLRMAH
jgi:HTH-type transcriptional regulator / antitoxin HigA